MLGTTIDLEKEKPPLSWCLAWGRKSVTHLDFAPFSWDVILPPFLGVLPLDSKIILSVGPGQSYPLRRSSNEKSERLKRFAQGHTARRNLASTDDYKPPRS